MRSTAAHATSAKFSIIFMQAVPAAVALALLLLLLCAGLWRRLARQASRAGTSRGASGGGVRGGVAHGSTDAFGYHALQNRHYITDLQATILRQMGYNATDLEVEIRGQPIRLIEEGEGPILPILS